MPPKLCTSTSYLQVDGWTILLYSRVCAFSLMEILLATRFLTDIFEGAARKNHNDPFAGSMTSFYTKDKFVTRCTIMLKTSSSTS